MKKVKRRDCSPAIYILVAAIPILIINCLCLFYIYVSEQREQNEQLRNISQRIQFELSQSVNDAVSVSDYLCMNSELKRFLTNQYENEREYYETFNQLMQDNVIRYYYTAQSVYNVTVATDNSTITNGTYFVQIEDIDEQEWYQKVCTAGQEILLCTYFEDDKYMQFSNRARHMSIVRNLDVDGVHAVLKLDMDYARMLQNILHESSDLYIYVCEGNKVVFSNNADDHISLDYKILNDYNIKEKCWTDTVNLLGNTWKIYIEVRKDGFFAGMKSRQLLLLFLVIVFDIFFFYVANRLSVRISNERRELQLSKTQAELNALQSQMNPHFMFNTLESIRMHSVIKGETETEEILGKFALLLRQASQWDRDFIFICEEIEFIKSYLDIQTYRFGDRIHYEISVEEICGKRKIPKFGILTFVENACVHGVERSTHRGNIMVSVREKGQRLMIEICDNGIGMSEEKLQELQRRLRNASIEDLNVSSRVGMINAVVRLKIYFDGDVEIQLNSCMNEGTSIRISLPLQYASRLEQDSRTNGGIKNDVKSDVGG